MKLAITGTPGTGKTTLAKALAAKLGCTLLDVNKIAVENKLYKKEKGTPEKIVDLKKLAAKIHAIAKKEKAFIAEGHLACEFYIPADCVVVLRCNPDTLEKRLQKREYSAKKIEENVMAEMLDYCLLKTEANYPKTKAKIVQINATKFTSPEKVLRLVAEGKSEFVDWMPILQKRLLAGATK
ncbi:MAG: AAA family ATPase [Candidatus Micrarchaeia archaeon]|jgi:adenylate kinase